MVATGRWLDQNGFLLGSRGAKWPRSSGSTQSQGCRQKGSHEESHNRQLGRDRELLVSAGTDVDGAAEAAFGGPATWVCHSCRRSSAWGKSITGCIASSFQHDASASSASSVKVCKGFGTTSKDEGSRLIVCCRCGRRFGCPRGSRAPAFYRGDTCLDATEPGNHSSGQPLSHRRPSLRAGKHQRILSRCWYKRRRKTGAAATGPCCWNQWILPSGATANFQEDEPCSASSTIRARAGSCRCIDVQLPGAFWRLQGQKRDGDDHVDAGALHGRRSKRRHAQDQGVPSHHLCMRGASGLRRELGNSLCLEPPRRAAESAVCRPSSPCQRPRKAIHATHSGALECGCPCISQGGRPPHQQEDRKQATEARSKSRESEAGQSLSQTTASQVPEEAEWGGSRSFQLVPDVLNACHGNRQDSTTNSCCLDNAPTNSCATVKLDADSHNPATQSLINSQTKCVSPLSRRSQAATGKSAGTRPKRPRGPKTKPPSEPRVFDYQRWCDRLTSAVLDTRSAFSAYLNQTIKLSRSCRDDRAIPTFFPIPVPFMGVYARMPANSPAAEVKARCISRAIHVMVSALNFWYNGGVFAQLDLQRRKPSFHHVQLYHRLRLLIESDGDVKVDDLPSAGRRFPELIARISEISEKLTRLGPTADPYDQTFHGVETDAKVDPQDELQPFHNMNPEKIRLHGRGHWDASPYLDDDVCMAYREPRSLLHNQVTPPGVLIRDAPETLAALALKWDQHDLLLLHDNPIHVDSRVRIFGAFKDEATHRQIGDRRGQNQRESKLQGPSHDLPSGADLCDLVVCPLSQRVCISISDRRDYYHQLKATRAKALANTIGPAVPESLLLDTSAYACYLLHKHGCKKDRLKHGDGLFADDFENMISPPPNHLWVSFSSVLQGDHAGVEIATQGHTALLQEGGLLGPESRMTASRPLRSQVQAEGLVIDDYFAVSFEQLGSHDKSISERCYDRAQEIYSREGLLGSPHKDLISVDEGRVIGAYVNGSQRAVSRGVVTVAAPAKKRLALSILTLEVARLPYTSDSLHLCLVGGWVSLLGFRRPMMAIMQDCFRVVDMETFDRDKPKLVKLTRRVAGELVLLSVLAPLAMSDIAVPFSDEIYCADASISHGAILKAKLKPEIAEVLWKTTKSKGAYSRLLTPLEATLRHLGELEEVPQQRRSQEASQTVERPLAFHYDFIETFAGAAKITRFLAQMGFTVGPPLDLSVSPEYDMNSTFVSSWISFMLSEKRLKSFFGGPPCTTFSIMRRPALRNAQIPFGFDTEDEQTRVGNELAHRGGQALYIAHQNDAAGILENPYSSFMKHLPFWNVLRRLPNSSEVRTDSCRFGSPHLKSFRLLGVNVDLSVLARRCVCKAKHVVVQGGFTKISATYTDQLAQAIASVLAESIRRHNRRLKDLEDPPVKGLENQLTNEVMQTAQWELVKCWSFKKQSHINILEESAVLKLCLWLAKQGSPRRFSVLVDSNVVVCCTSKGRTSSLGLGSILRRVCATMVAAGLYISVPFCPTRLNASDDPTRQRPIRQPVKGMNLDSWSRDELFDLAALPKLKKWASNWARLVVHLLGPSCLCLHDRSVYRQKFSLGRDPISHLTSRIFDSTKGYPGEGPCNHLVACSVSFGSCLRLDARQFKPYDNPNPCRWNLITGTAGIRRPRCSSWFVPFCSFSWLFLFFLLLVVRVEAMPIAAVTPAENRRAAERRQRPDLRPGRPVTDATTGLRERYWDIFLRWAYNEGLDIDATLLDYMYNIDELNFIMVRYGRELYRAGKTYNQFAETLNALTTLKPGLRRMLTAAWDLGLSWTKQEPSQHHIPLPVPILLAMISLSLTWGWVYMAGILALGFGGLLRPGEIVNALRSDLLLPRDSGFSAAFVLLTIREPKSRFTYARVQTAKVDSADLVSVIDLAFRGLTPGARLWPFSAQTLRTRLRSLMSSLQLPTTSSPGQRCLDLGSLRSGGATFIILSTENGELCRRRGRWANAKMMEIYVQESMAIQYMSMIPSTTRHLVIEAASLFQHLLMSAQRFQEASIPTHLWYVLFSSQWKMT